MAIGAASASAPGYVSSSSIYGVSPAALTPATSSTASPAQSSQQASANGSTRGSDSVGYGGGASGGGGTAFLQPETIGPVPMIDKPEKTSKAVVEAQNKGMMAIVIGCGVIAAAAAVGVPAAWILAGKQSGAQLKAYMETNQSLAKEIADGKRQGKTQRDVQGMIAARFGDDAAKTLKAALPKPTAKDGTESDLLRQARLALEPPEATESREARAEYTGRGIAGASDPHLFRARAIVVDALASQARGEAGLEEESALHRAFVFGDHADAHGEGGAKAHAAWQAEPMHNEFAGHARYIKEVVDPIIRTAAHRSTIGAMR